MIIWFSRIYSYNAEDYLPIPHLFHFMEGEGMHSGVGLMVAFFRPHQIYTYSEPV